MKKIVFLLSILVFIQTRAKAQTYFPGHPLHFKVCDFTAPQGYANNGVTITTRIPSDRVHEVTVFIRGFDNTRTIGIQLSWFSNGSEIYNQSASSTGGWTPPITLDNRGPYVQIGLNDYADELKFEISAIETKKEAGWFTDWNIEEGTLGGLEVNYINKFQDVWTKNLYAEGSVNAPEGHFNYIGIGTNDLWGPFQVAANNRTYYANRPIVGATWNAAEFGSSIPINGYVVLHPYAPNAMVDINPYISGRITASSNNYTDNIRVGSEINSTSTTNSNRASMIDYNQSGVTRLVILTYAGVQYVALEISHLKSITDITFTGYAKDENFFFVSGKTLDGRNGGWVDDVNIQSVQAYPSVALDPISITGPLKLKSLLNTTNNKVLSTDANGNVQLITYTPYWQPHNNASTTNPTTIGYNGTVYIGANPTSIAIGESSYKLVVGGTIGANKVKVTQQGWADYVFDEGYHLLPLTEVEKFIKANKHLPDVPTTSEVKKDGVDVAETQALLLKKVEELTLYVIGQNKRLDNQNKQITQQREEIEKLKSELSKQPKK